MGVEAGARGAARRAGAAPARSTSPPPIPAYLDKTNATAIHAALGLPTLGVARRHGRLGALRRRRAARGARRAARRRWPCSPTSAPGCPAARDERDGGDGAAAFLFGDERRAPSAEPIGGGVGDRGVPRPLARCPASRPRAQWEERFGEHAYVPLGEAALDRRAQERRASTAPTSTTSIVAGPHGRARQRAWRQRVGVPGRSARRRPRPRRSATPARRTPGCCSPTRSTGPSPARRSHRGARWPTAPTSRVLARDRRARRRTAPARAGAPTQVAAGARRSAYATFLTWRGLLDREPPRRPDPEPPGGAAGAPRRGVEVRRSSAAAARRAASVTCRRSGCA